MEGPRATQEKKQGTRGLTQTWRLSEKCAIGEAEQKRSEGQPVPQCREKSTPACLTH